MTVKTKRTPEQIIQSIKNSIGTELSTQFRGEIVDNKFILQKNFLWSYQKALVIEGAIKNDVEGSIVDLKFRLNHWAQAVIIMVHSLLLPVLFFFIITSSTMDELVKAIVGIGTMLLMINLLALVNFNYDLPGSQKRIIEVIEGHVN